MQNSENEILIDSYCIVNKSDNKLTIYVSESKLSLFYQFLILLFILVPLSSIIVILTINNIIVGVSFLCLSSLLCIFLYYKFKKETFNIDKSSQTITFQKVFIYLKQIRTFNFSEIEWLIYRRDQRDYGNFHILEFVLKDTKDIKLFKGFKEECKELGSIISEFVDKKLYGP